MSPDTLFLVALLVFVLMVIGLGLSLREFTNISEEPSSNKDTPGYRKHDPMGQDNRG